MAPGQSKLGRPSLWNRWTSVVRLDAQHPDRSLQRRMHDMRGRHVSRLLVICKSALAPGGAPLVLMLGLTPPSPHHHHHTHTHLSLTPSVFSLRLSYQCHTSATSATTTYHCHIVVLCNPVVRWKNWELLKMSLTCLKVICMFYFCVFLNALNCI